MRAIHIFLVALVISFCLPNIQSQTLFVPGGTGGVGISNNGNVGIGTNNPGARLDVTGGNIKINTSGESDIHYLLDGGNQWEVGTNNAGNGEGNNHFFIFDNDYRFTVQRNTGNIGIGTRFPGHKLNLYGNHLDSRFLIHSTGGGTADKEADLMLWASEPGSTYEGVGIGNNVMNNYANGSAFNRINTARGGSYMRLLSNAISFNLVSSSGADKLALHLADGGNLNFYNYNGAQINLNSSGAYWGKIGNPAAQVWSLGYGSGGTDITSVLSWTATGNVLIGKTTQTPSGVKYKLDVAGPIRADEIVVNTTGADFVFEPTYKLRTLAELETFIKANKHLPDIAPAKEMQENGVSAGEMQAKLLQKVEELTLYVIELKKENENLKKRVEKIEKK